MSIVAAIVEGDGEVAALPILLRRINEWRTPGVYVQVLTPIRVRREKFLNQEKEFFRHLRLAAEKCGPYGWILILLDADDDCPSLLGQHIFSRAQAVAPDRRIAVVLANREYEAWFIASAASLNGQRGFRYDPDEYVEAELPRNAKGWIGRHIIGGGYSETIDQAAFSARLDLQMAFENSRSFRKLCGEWDRNVEGDR